MRPKKNRFRSLFGKLFKKARSDDVTQTSFDDSEEGSDQLASYTKNVDGTEDSVDVQEPLPRTTDALHGALRERSTTCTAYALHDGTAHCAADGTPVGLRAATGAGDNGAVSTTKERQHARETSKDQSVNRGNSQKIRNSHSKTAGETVASQSDDVDRSDVSRVAMLEKSSVGTCSIKRWKHVPTDIVGRAAYDRVADDHVMDRWRGSDNQPLTPCGTIPNVTNLAHEASPLHPSPPLYRSTLGNIDNKNRNELLTSWGRTPQYGSDVKRGPDVQRTKSCRAPLKTSQCIAAEVNSDKTDGRSQVTLRRRSTISSADHAQQTTAGTVHYHLNIENCDGMNVYVNGTDMCQLPSRSVHVSRVGDVKRLSWVVDLNGTPSTGGGTGVVALPGNSNDGTSKHPWNIDAFDFLPPDDEYGLSGTTTVDSKYPKDQMRRPDFGINGFRNQTPREQDADIRHTTQYQRQRHGGETSTWASADTKHTYVGIPDMLQQDLSAHQVVIDGRFSRRNPQDTAIAGQRRLKTGASSLPLFGTIRRRTRELNSSRTMHDRVTGSDQERYTLPEPLIRSSFNPERNGAMEDTERSLMTSHIKEQQTTTQGCPNHEEAAPESLSQRSVNVDSASVKPIAVVTPNSRVNDSRNGRPQTRETTRGTSDTDRSRVGAAPLPTANSATTEVNERLMPRTLAENTTSRERSTTVSTTASSVDRGYAAANHLQITVATIKLQLLQVPGVLIVAIRDTRIAVFLSEDRLNVDGVDHFMRLHGVSEQDYFCELLPRREMARRQVRSGRLAVR